MAGAILVKGYLDLDKIKTSGKIVELKSGKKALYFDCWINDEKGQYGDHGGIFTSQTKEEQEAKTKKTFIGNLTATYNKEFDPVKACVKKEIEVTTEPDW